jgi:hypothetical protein
VGGCTRNKVHASRSSYTLLSRTKSRAAQMDTDHREIIALARTSSDEDILELLGKFNPDALFGLPQTRANLISSGKAWFEKHGDALKRQWCAALTKDKSVIDPFSEEFVGAMYAALSHDFGKALAVYLTALVLRKIVAGWCSGSENIT